MIERTFPILTDVNFAPGIKSCSYATCAFVARLLTGFFICCDPARSQAASPDYGLLVLFLRPGLLPFWENFRGDFAAPDQFLQIANDGSSGHPKLASESRNVRARF